MIMGFNDDPNRDKIGFNGDFHGIQEKMYTEIE